MIANAHAGVTVCVSRVGQLVRERRVAVSVCLKSSCARSESVSVTDPSVQSHSESAKLTLHGECCIESLAERREELLRSLEDGLPVVIDMSGVSRIDTAGLQLVLAFVVGMRGEGRGVSYAGVSQPVREAARLAGVSALLGM
jgi:ABC-type transporter Mla MlaB component